VIIKFVEESFMFKALLCYVLLTAAALANSNTLTRGLRAGVYDGQSRDIKMFVRDLPGRDGSFLALIIKDGAKAVPYLVDEFAVGRYGFIPLYNQNNLIGASNYTPSLTASVIVDGSSLRINMAPNPGNNIGFNIAEVFKSTKEKMPWLPNTPGTYSYKGARKSTTLSPPDANRESQLTISAGNMAGSYVLREVRPGMHLAFKSTLTTTGVEVVEESRYVVVFLRGCFSWSDKMVFIDTSNWSMKEFTHH
jgi:hypothetical protein